MITNSLLSIALLLSFRTPKTDNPTDWLYMMEAANKSLSVSVAWERDNGVDYTEEEYSIQHVFGYIKLKEYYVENFKQRYNQVSAQFAKDWSKTLRVSMGYAYQNGHSAIFESNWAYNNSLADSSGSVYNLHIAVKSGVVTEFKNVNAKLSVEFTFEWFTISFVGRDIGRESEYLQLKTGVKVKI